MNTNLIFDGMNLAHRAWNAFQNPARGVDLKTSTGERTGMLFGALRVLRSVAEKVHATKIIGAWDSRPVGRISECPTYKAGRAKQPSEFYQDIAKMRDFLALFGVEDVASPGAEADDVIATLVKSCGGTGDVFFILSSDDDFMQLISSRVLVVKPPMGKHESEIIDLDGVKEKWGVDPALIPHVRAILGDKSDNLPGVPRFGQDEAVRLVNECGSVEEVLNRVASVKGGRGERLAACVDQVRMNFRLMELKGIPLENLEYGAKERNWDAARQEVDRLEMNSIAKSWDTWKSVFASSGFVKVG